MGRRPPAVGSAGSRGDARLDRAGDRWWIGSLSALEAHRQTVALRFLDPGRTYTMHLIRDDGRGGLAVEDRAVTAADAASVSVERNGGFAAELTPRR